MACSVVPVGLFNFQQTGHIKVDTLLTSRSTGHDPPLKNTHLMEYQSLFCVTGSRFKDGERVRCRVLAPLATADRAPKASSKKKSGDGASGRGPVELSLRQSRLEQPDREEAVKRRGVPDVGSTAKVKK